VASCAVAGEVHSGDVTPILSHIPIRVIEDSAQHARPGFSDHKEAALVWSEFLSGAIDDGGIDTEEWQRSRSRFRGSHARRRRDHDDPRLRLPPRVHDRTALVADDVLVPNPGFGIDRLPDRAEQSE